MKHDIWMPIYIGDYLSDTLGLTLSQHGCYFLLMMGYWKKRGPLPDAEARSMMRDASVTDCERIAKFFVVKDGFWHHKRIDTELARALKNKDSRSSAAITASNARWKRSKTSSVTHPSRITDASLTDVPSPSPSPSDKGEGEAPPFKPKRITGRGELPLTEGQTNHAGRHNTEIEAPSWEEFWKYCQHIGMHGEAYALDKFHAADQKHWQNAPNWSAYASRVKAWWEQDGKPMTSPEGNGAPAPKVFPETQLKVIEAALLDFPCNPKSTRNLMGKTYPPEMLEKYRALKKKRDELRQRISKA